MLTEEERKQISHFLSRGGVDLYYNTLQQHILEGWKWNTVLSYNGAVKKFLKYQKENSVSAFDLPASEDDIYGFCIWAGRTNAGPTKEDILSQTLEKYLYGLKAWHLYHKENFPKVNEATIKLMLTASKKIDVKAKEKGEKKAVHLKHLLCLADGLVGRGNREIAIFDTVLIAFWSLARLGELTGNNERNGGLVLRSDARIVMDGTNEEGFITLKNAKTAKAGETQVLQLKGLNNVLCPVGALRRRLADCIAGEDPLFSYRENSQKIPLSKQLIMTSCMKLWEKDGFRGITGHSFRVGGASLRFALGVPVPQICEIGRWKSDSWKLYIKGYSPEELKDTKDLLFVLSIHKLHD